MQIFHDHAIAFGLLPSLYRSSVCSCSPYYIAPRQSHLRMKGKPVSPTHRLGLGRELPSQTEHLDLSTVFAELADLDRYIFRLYSPHIGILALALERSGIHLCRSREEHCETGGKPPHLQAKSDVISRLTPARRSVRFEDISELSSPPCYALELCFPTLC